MTVEQVGNKDFCERCKMLILLIYGVHSFVSGACLLHIWVAVC